MHGTRRGKKRSAELEIEFVTTLSEKLGLSATLPAEHICALLEHRVADAFKRASSLIGRVEYLTFHVLNLAILKCQGPGVQRCDSPQSTIHGVVALAD